ncbi:hypothetical protein DPMN_065323 [Dreissena polymorpha]|uniref:Uncharacterized protein n=1 Tax=Dreissena polymorpha TaxID=45954 RepID=A0A9D4CEE5_DREPO|nr:hypothetical protein DPMN_065323 [Dreissena polymorpha]
METWETNTKLFHKLVKNQRQSMNDRIQLLKVDGEDITGSENILNAWKCHFEKLATPDEDNYGENDKVSLAEEQNNIIEEIIKESGENIDPVTVHDVNIAINLLNTGKAAYANGISAELFKYAKEEISSTIADIINSIFTELDYHLL